MKNYLTNCVCSNAESIDEMYDEAIEIEYDDFIQQVDADQLMELFPHYDWAEDDGLKLEDDFTVSFWQSKYLKKSLCLYRTQLHRIHFLLMPP